MRYSNLDLAGDALIIVPPFASTTMPSLSAHLLQACARKIGFSLRVLYANFMLAETIGLSYYEALSRGPVKYMLGERLFCSVAYDLPPFGNDHFLDHHNGIQINVKSANTCIKINAAELLRIEKFVHAWVEEIVGAIVEQHFKVVGCTTMFEQTGASIALLNRVKSLSPATVTVLGGANCQGEMAEGILTISNGVDYIFSGEGERSFTAFLIGLQAGSLPAQKIIGGNSCLTLDEIPTPDYFDFFTQRRRWLDCAESDGERNLWLIYESSRGCWWGRKHQCTFCGLNGQTLTYRQKSADRVLSDIQTLVDASPTKQICMTDNIMPRDYIRNFLPKAQKACPGATFFYEVKANLSLDDVITPVTSGVTQAQPGIESLSSACLELMKKGVSPRQNINLLRYARAAGLSLAWNILYALPGDELDDYKNIEALIPLLRHLHPPLGLSHLSIERFSPYFEDFARHEIKNLRPVGSYYAVFPPHADVTKLAYHFEGEYGSASKANPALMKRIERGIEEWRSAWDCNEEQPVLGVCELDEVVTCFWTRAAYLGPKR